MYKMLRLKFILLLVTNHYTNNTSGIGSGATCYCPNGESYAIGDFGTACGALACIGGVTSECQLSVSDGAYKMVICERKRIFFKCEKLNKFVFCTSWYYLNYKSDHAEVLFS